MSLRGLLLFFLVVAPCRAPEGNIYFTTRDNRRFAALCADGEVKCAHPWPICRAKMQKTYRLPDAEIEWLPRTGWET